MTFNDTGATGRSRGETSGNGGLSPEAGAGVPREPGLDARSLADLAAQDALELSRTPDAATMPLTADGGDGWSRTEASGPVPRPSTVAPGALEAVKDQGSSPEIQSPVTPRLFGQTMVRGAAMGQPETADDSKSGSGSGREVLRSGPPVAGSGNQPWDHGHDDHDLTPRSGSADQVLEVGATGTPGAMNTDTATTPPVTELDPDHRDSSAADLDTAGSDSDSNPNPETPSTSLETSQLSMEPGPTATPPIPASFLEIHGPGHSDTTSLDTTPDLSHRTVEVRGTTGDDDPSADSPNNLNPGGTDNPASGEGSSELVRKHSDDNSAQAGGTGTGQDGHEGGRGDGGGEGVAKGDGDDSGEGGRNAFLQVSDRCQATIRAEVAVIQRRLAKGEPVGYNSDIAGRVIAGLVVEAVKAGAVQQAEENFVTLCQLPEVSTTIVADAACAIIAATDSQGVSETLHYELDKEKTKAIDLVVRTKQNIPGTLYPPVSDVLLESVIEACEERSMSPDVWIKHAINDERKWMLYALHYARMAQEGKPEAAAYKEKLAEHLKGEGMEPTFLYYHARPLLDVVKGPEMRERLLDQYMEAAGKVLPNASKEILSNPKVLLNMMNAMNAFAEHISVGTAVLNDLSLANPDNIKYFEATINAYARFLLKAGINPSDVEGEQLVWGILLKRYSVEPQKLIEYLDLQTGHLQGDDAAWRGGDDAPWIDLSQGMPVESELRDNTLVHLARQSMDRGDFSSAGLFINNIGDEDARALALKACLLDRVTTQAQIEAVKPDQMTLDFNPEIETQFQVAKALVAADREQLSALSLELVRAAVTDDEGNVQVYIQRMYQAVAAQDAEAGRVLATELLAAFRAIERAKGVELYNTTYFSEMLIDAGNANELTKRYEAIDRDKSNPSYRLKDLWELARRARRAGTRA